MKALKRVVLLWVLVSLPAMNVAGCTSKDEMRPVVLGEYNNTAAMVLVEYQVWHGLPSHSQAFSGEPLLPNERPYDSRDPGVIARHIQSAKERGIDGFVVNWYGPKASVPKDDEREFQDLATAELISQAETQDFYVALMYDEGAIKSAETDTAMYMARAKSDLRYAERYYGSSAYLVIDGHPALFIFSYDDVKPYLDWTEIREHLTLPVTLFDRDPNPLEPDYDAKFDGFYSWVWATNGNWDPDGQEKGHEYLDWFYATMGWGVYADKVTVGGVWPGFDDTLAPWGQNRFMVRAGSKTHDGILALAENNNVPYIMVGTWNDFEEGTDIEYGVHMQVILGKPGPELLLRSTPVMVDWDSSAAGSVLQVYKDHQLIYDQPHTPGVYLSLTPGCIYELKVWIPTSSTPLSQYIKIRREDPVPDVVPVVVE